MNNIQKINHLIAQLDKKIEQQLGTILNQPELTNLQASWSGLYYVVHQNEPANTTKIKLLNISWKTLSRDINRSASIEQCQLFDKITEHEFGIAGGEPFGLLIGDYRLDLSPVSNNQSLQDIAALQSIADIAAASFSIFVTAINATIFGVDNFRQLANQLTIDVKLSGYHQQYWQALRESEASRFIGLIIPQLLLNSHYEKHVALHRQYYTKPINIWGNAVYAYASIFLTSFKNSGWFLDALGTPEPSQGINGGIVNGLTANNFFMESQAIAPHLLTDFLLTNQQEQQLNAQGFIALCQIPHNAKISINHSPSLKKSPPLDSEQDISGEQLASLIPYLLCICRFAHYLKILGREKLGKYQNTKDCEHELQKWLNQYIASNTDISLAMKARFPLLQGEIKIALQQDGHEHYFCAMRLSPQLRTHHVMATVLLKTSIRLLS